MLIKTGDVIRNSDDVPLRVESVEEGEHGILCTGKFPNGDRGQAYCIPELPLVDKCIRSWHSFACRCFVTLANDCKVACVGSYSDEYWTPADYDAAFNEAIAAMKPEMGVKPFEVGK